MTNQPTRRCGWTATLLAVAAATLPLCPVVAVAWADHAWSDRTTVTITGRAATTFPDNTADRRATGAEPTGTPGAMPDGTAGAEPIPSASVSVLVSASASASASASTVDSLPSAGPAAPSGSPTP